MAEWLPKRAQLEMLGRQTGEGREGGEVEKLTEGNSYQLS